jgi:hypothetical protein
VTEGHVFVCEELHEEAGYNSLLPPSLYWGAGIQREINKKIFRT